MKTAQVEDVLIRKVRAGMVMETTDQVAIEEPLGIQLAYSTANGYMRKNVAVTMRTPGHDDDLAAGFLFTEGIIKNEASIEKVSYISGDENSILVTLKENIVPVIQNLERNFYTTSSCGICGKASIDSIRTESIYKKDAGNINITASALYKLQEKLKEQQTIFRNTGGIHASALFTLNMDLSDLREDVGRHNALDKIIGAAFMSGRLPLDNCVLLLSGRASFELLQKAAMAGIKVVAAIGAPSSLAVELAKDHGISLLGFLRDGSFNLYSGYQRINISAL